MQNELLKEIEDLQTQINLEKRTYTKQALKNKLNTLKQSLKSQINTPNYTAHLNQININCTNQSINSDKLILTVKDNFKGKFTSKDCFFEEIRNSELEVEALDSVVLSRVENCVFNVRCNQLRLKECVNVKLVVFSRTGIFLEKSKGIKISGFKEENNLYFQVKDFTNPIGKDNYSIED